MWGPFKLKFANHFIIYQKRSLGTYIFSLTVDSESGLSRFGTFKVCPYNNLC